MVIQQTIRSLANQKKAKDLQWFFKTGKGQYGEGDVFLGVVVPQVRALVKKYPDTPIEDINTLLSSIYHEERLLALLILVSQFEKGDAVKKKEIFSYYLKHTDRINNWDLVDLSAPRIVGAYLNGKGKTVRMKLARSKNIWERRIAVLSTFFDITHGNSEHALSIAEILIHDKEDLIHKAVGWMLREVGKRVGQNIEEEFLRKWYKTMPRTMLRYAIERFEEAKRKKYLTNAI
jgi:3-methyladenine DNA glycosylase AlkD